MKCSNKPCKQTAEYRYNCKWYCYLCYLKESQKDSLEQRNRELKATQKDQSKFLEMSYSNQNRLKGGDFSI